MCDSCDACFTKEEKKQLKKLGWKENEINYVENSIVEDRIKEMIENAIK